MKAIIFDVDDTLINSREHTVEGIIITAKKMGIRVPTEKEVGRLFGLPWKTIMDKLWPNINVGEFNESFEKYEFIDNPTEATEGAVQEIGKLKNNGLFLGIITSRRSLELKDILSEAGFNFEDFSYVGTNDQNEYAKPDPRVFDNLKKELKEYNMVKDDILYIGDAIYDFQAAQGAGIGFIAYINGAYSEEEFIEEGLPRECTMRSFRELPLLLENYFKITSIK